MKFPIFTRSVPVTVEDIYGRYLPEFLNYLKGSGYVPTGHFRVPNKTDLAYLGTGGGIFMDTGSDFRGQPRIILKPCRRRVITFTETGEVRPTGWEDWYRPGGSDTCYQNPTTTPHAIYTRTETVIETEA